MEIRRLKMKRLPDKTKTLLFVVGIFFVLPCIESYQKVDLRTITLGVPPQEVGRSQSCNNTQLQKKKYSSSAKLSYCSTEHLSTTQALLLGQFWGGPLTSFSSTVWTMSPKVTDIHGSSQILSVAIELWLFTYCNCVF